MKIFVSYSHKDEVTALKLVSVLEPFHTIWIDSSPESLTGGEDWERAIARGIRKCDIFLFLASPSSCESQWCLNEIGQALRWKKPIIPVVTQNGLVLPKKIARLQWVFLDDSETSIRKLLIATVRRKRQYWVWVALIESLAIAYLLFFH